MTFWELTSTRYIVFELYHRLKVDLDIQNLFGLHVHRRTHWLRPPPSRIWAYTVYALKMKGR
jgi:hypothetical protein